MTTYYVYVLPHVREPRFKVGKSSGLWHRIQNIGVKELDFTKTFALRVESAEEATNLERILQRTFKGYRLPAIAPNGREGRGHTEWFHLDALEPLEAFLAREKHLLNFTREAVERPTPKERPVTIAMQRRRDRVAKELAVKEGLKAISRRLEDVMQHQRGLLEKLAQHSAYCGVLGFHWLRDRCPHFIGMAQGAERPAVEELLGELQSSGVLEVLASERPDLLPGEPVRLYSRPTIGKDKDTLEYSFAVMTEQYYGATTRSVETRPFTEQALRALRQFQAYGDPALPIQGWFDAESPPVSPAFYTLLARTWARLCGPEEPWLVITRHGPLHEIDPDRLGTLLRKRRLF